MLKKILYVLMVVVIVAGGVYSFQKVGFARKTAMFFQVWLGDGAAMGPGGGHQMGGQPGQGGMPGGGQPGQGGSQQAGMPVQSGDQQAGMPGQAQQGAGQAQPEGATGQVSSEGRGTPPAMGSGQPGMQEGGNRGNGPPGGMKGGPGGGYLSLRNVWQYTFIFAFFTLIAQVLDGRSRRSRKK